MKEKASKDFEQQVERVFSALEDKSTRVEWNVKIRDPDTGQARQIDVRIVREGGSTIHVECRDKKRPQDVMWIEELIGRRDSLGADTVIAVSASGFSGPALAKAKAKGVLTRHLRNIDPKDLQIIADQPEIWLPVADNISFAVEFSTPFHEYGSVSIVYEQHKIDFMAAVMQEVVTYVTIVHDYGMPIPENKRKDVEYTFTSKVAAHGIDLKFTVTIRLETRWQKLRIRTRSFSRKEGKSVSIEAEVHSGDIHGVLAEIVITEKVWSIIIDLSRAVFPRGTAVSPALFFGNKYMGGKQMKFSIRLFEKANFTFQASDRLLFDFA